MRKKFLPFAIIILFCTTFFISHYWIQLVLIQGSSMPPAYHPWQLAIIYKQAPQLKAGDVIAFQCDTLDAVLIKRIVACPNDTVHIENGILYINGSANQEISSDDSISYAGIAVEPITLTSDEYFVFYEYSKDSRYPEIGCVKEEDIYGIIFPQVHLSK